MKSVFFILSLAISTLLCAQTRTTYGLFSKTDGTKIKGSSVARGYENQIEIIQFTGGSDNSATIEIEVPMGAYVAEFRNIMNNAASASQPRAITKPAVASKPVLTSPTVIKKDIPIKTSPNITATQPAFPTLIKMELSVTETNSNNYGSKIMNKIIMEDIKVESCIDDVATGKSKIKLKAQRIGWIYYSYEATSGKLNAVNKSGWNTVTGTSWTGF